MDSAPLHLKIQVRAPGVPDVEHLPWADLEAIPDFHSYGEANQWLVDNGLMKLSVHGINFRIVPADFTCFYAVALEKNSDSGSA